MIITGETSVIGQSHLQRAVISVQNFATDNRQLVLRVENDLKRDFPPWE